MIMQFIHSISFLWNGDGQESSYQSQSICRQRLWLSTLRGAGAEAEATAATENDNLSDRLTGQHNRPQLADIGLC